MMLRRAGVVIALLCSALSLQAQSYDSVVIGGDTISYKYTSMDQTSRQRGFGLNLYDYTRLLPDEPKRVNFSVVGGPGYSETRGWQLSLRAAMQYRSPQRSELINELSVYAAASLRGCYDVGVEGYNFLTSSRHRIYYGGSVSSSPTYLYGLDYAASSADDPGLYTDKLYRAEIGYDWQISEIFSAGVHADYRHQRATKLDDRAATIVAHRTTSYSGGGVGIRVKMSTHKVLDINLQRGVVVRADATLRPKLLGSLEHNVWQFAADVNYYQPLWKWGLLAFDVYGEHSTKHTPWMLRSALGSDSRMRGYYYSRYNGDTLLGAQVELRQRVWEGLVVAGWGGAATAFSEGDTFSWRNVLPNYGVGIRWYADAHSAVRIDLGFGRHGSSFIVGLSEAF